MSLLGATIRLPGSTPLDAMAKVLTRFASRVVPVKHAFACDPNACTCYYCGIDTHSTCCFQLICC